MSCAKHHSSWYPVIRLGGRLELVVERMAAIEKYSKKNTKDVVEDSGEDVRG